MAEQKLQSPAIATTGGERAEKIKNRKLKQESFTDWYATQLDLLTLEQNEGVAKHEQKKLSINKLQLAEVKIGAFGKVNLTLTRDKSIKSSGIQPGNPVRLLCPKWDTGTNEEGDLRGIVKSIGEHDVEVICKGQSDGGDGKLQPSADHDVTIESLPDEITIKRINKALSTLVTPNNDNNRWIRLFFGDDDGSYKPRFRSVDGKTLGEVLTKSSLNESQANAVKMVSTAMDVAIIHGPPGTGKTTTLIKAIESILTANPQARILCCAPSNVAVDNLVALLARKKYSIVRLGHPSRVNPLLVAHTLDAILARSEMSQLVKDAKKELLETRDFSRKRELRKEIKNRERDYISEVIKSSQIVLSTISSSSDVAKFAPRDFSFSHLIVDEAAQAMEASIWVPMQYLDQTNGVLILAGDHKQLPPTILNDAAARKGLGFTLMERIISKYKSDCSVMLSIQYRMCTPIMTWSSLEMYGGELKADDTVSRQSLKDLITVQDTEDESLFAPLVFIDTAGCGLNEADLNDPGDLISSESRSNLGEVELVAQQVERLLRSGLEQQQIAVVTPYRAQVEAISNRLQASPSTDMIEVRTVDGFQGQERQAIILSMVRSNPERKVGFLADERRLNVAITRAKRHVCMIGDSQTLEFNPFLKRLVAYFSEHGEVHSGAEFIETFATSETRTVSKSRHQQAGTAPKKTVQNSASAVKIKPSTAKQSTAGLSKSGGPQTSSISGPLKPSKPLTIVKPQFGNEGKSKSQFAALDDEDEDEEDVDEQVASSNEHDAVVEEDEIDTVKVTSEATKSVQVPKKQHKKKSKNKNDSAAVVEDEAVDDDDEEEWAFLEQQAKAANRCVFPNCSVYVELVGHTCLFCKERFCLQHCQAEKHGCGDVARRKAFQGNGKKPPIKAREREKLKVELQKKIQSEEKNRAHKVPPKAKKG